MDTATVINSIISTSTNPHSNAAEESIFSMIAKINTKYCPSLDQSSFKSHCAHKHEQTRTSSPLLPLETDKGVACEL